PQNPHFQKYRYLQQNTTISRFENLRYSIYIKTQMGESEPMDLPFLLSQSRIFQASSLTPDEKLGNAAYIHLVSAIF
ncbi:MAG: hypothetical protein PVG06_11745, partial [Desulfobacterales bacterium]